MLPATAKPGQSPQFAKSHHLRDFRTMAPLVPALAQSESKARFFARLGLDPSNALHKRVYALMKMEAAEGRRRLMEGQSSDTAQIHEAAWAREVTRIYNNARTETRAVYQFGVDGEDRNSEPDNWIIRWLLWHVFRYRDYRNKGRPPGSPAGSATPASIESDDEDDDEPPQATFPVAAASSQALRYMHAAAASQPGIANGSAAQYWDPVRERWQSS